MATAPRRLNVGDVASTGRLRNASGDAHAVGAAGIALANELLSRSVVSLEIAEHALEGLRRASCAVEAAFWFLTEVGAVCALRVGDRALDHPLPTIQLINRSLLVERLRRRGGLLCRAGEATGVEELVPGSANSCAVVSSSNDAGVIGLLVLAWDAKEPPCDETALSHLQLAAGAVLRTLPAISDEGASLADEMLRSITDRVVVISRNGNIMAVNAAWSDSPLEQLRASDPGAGYFELCRRIGGHSRHAQALIDGIQSVATGASPFFQSRLVIKSVGKEERLLVTATPRRPSGSGAVITHATITAQVDDSAMERSGERLFEGLIDALPMPIWIHDDRGVVIHRNARWQTAIDGAHAEQAPRQWTDLFHPDDHDRVVAAFDDARRRRAALSIEVRMLTDGGAYRLAACDLSPYTDRDDRVRGYVGSCSDISAQRHAEQALGAMGSRLIAAQEEERSRIARELHDDLGQQTALLASKIELLLRSSKANALSLRKGIAEAKQNVNDLAVSIHNLSHQLHPPKLKLLGLMRTLEALCRNVSKESGVQVSFRTTPVPSGIPERVALCLCRVAQEALQNAVKHSGARRVDLSLSADESELTLRVSDAGCGFDPASPPGSGIGLLSMRERVELNAGRLLIETSPAGGTTVAATLPVEPPY